jgi:hypothetical protein
MPQPTADMTYTDFFKARTELVKALADSARSYIQISAAALALPLLFSRALLAQGAGKSDLYALGTSWSLVAACAFLSGSHCVRALLSVAYCSAALGQAPQRSHHRRIRHGMGRRKVDVYAEI